MNIKESKNEFEARMYIIGAQSTLLIDVITIEGNNDSLTANKNKILLFSANLARKEDILLQGSKTAAKVFKISSGNRCDCEIFDF